jgi:hypothetical protein
VWDEELPDPVTEPCYRAFLRLWAFFTVAETVTGASFNSYDVEDTYAVRQHLAADWERLHPRVRAWIGESEAWWHEVSLAWGSGSTDERRRAHLRAYFRPQFVALSRLWSAGGRSQPTDRSGGPHTS